MKISNLIKDSYYRIKITHIIAFTLLIISAIFFTNNFTAILIQLVTALVIAIHHVDSYYVKQNLIDSKNKLKEEKEIFDRNVVVSETDLNGLLTYVNNNYIKMTGYSKDELIGSNHSKIRSAETTDFIYKKLWDTIKKDKTYIGVFKNIKKDGTSFWTSTHISPIILNNKKVGYKAIMFDVTDNIKAQIDLKHTIEDKELKIKEQATKFAFAINSSRDGFWDYDLIKKEFYLSDGWKKRLGFKEDEKPEYIDYLSLIEENNRFKHHLAMHDLIELHQ
ncbi:MAG: PAS domain S-box protein, partial [Sulfurimonas sp.]|nr:PAS domain S-box protein [Sulfurimonas sp.]